jgi:signal transduction histidine kinase
MKNREKSILIVDDEEDICEMLSISLTDQGYEVLTARNGEEALRLFRVVNPPIVLSDIRMPGIDGIEILRKIKEEKPETEVIMITGHGDLDLAIRSLKYEATDFITKPIHDEVLEIALKRAHERISMRQKIREHIEHLEKLVHEISGLSHTIKSLAGGLEGGTFVLEKGIALGHREYLIQGWGMIRSSVDRIRNLAMDLLNFAKPSELLYRLCDPNKPVKEVADLVKSRAQEHGIELKTSLAPDLDLLRFDQNAVQRCLLDLVTNAMDAVLASDRSDKAKEVMIRTLKADGWGVEYQVVDNGCGMEKETQERIFKGFFSTKGMTGTGVGLMVTKKIVDAHKGLLQVESAKDLGTKVTIKLPVRD